MADPYGTPPPALPTPEMLRIKIENFPSESIEPLKPHGSNVRTHLLQIDDLAEAYMVDDFFKSSAPIIDATKNMQSKMFVFLFKSTIHGSFRNRYFPLPPHSILSALTGTVHKKNHVFTLADNPPGHLDTFSIISEFTVAHLNHHAFIVAADPNHSAASKLSFLRRIMKIIESEDTNYIFYSVLSI